MVENKLLEEDLKVIALNSFISKGYIDLTSTVINEFTIDNFSRRVDIALITKGNLIAVEIKSDSDSLVRLEGQTKKYLEYFDKVIILSSKRHLSKILSLVPSNVEVWTVCAKGKVKIEKRGRLKKIEKKSNYLDLLKKDELSSLSKIMRLDSKDKSKQELKIDIENKIDVLPFNKIKEFLVYSIKRRFSETSSNFLREVIGKGNVALSDMSLLRPYNSSMIVKEYDFNNVFEIKNEKKGLHEDPFLVSMAKKSISPIFGEIPIHIKKIIDD